MTETDIINIIMKDKRQAHNRIASAILSSGRSQSWIAHRLGVGRSTVAAWVNPDKHTVPDRETICRLAIILNVDIRYLLNATDIEQIEYNSDAVHDAVKGASDQVRNAGSRRLDEFFYNLSSMVEASEGYRSIKQIADRQQDKKNQQIINNTSVNRHG